MKTALLHPWLVRMRGGERVLEAVLGLYPEADLFTLVRDPAGLSEVVRRRPARTSWLQWLPGATRRYPQLLPLHPLASRFWDLRDYGLVISIDSALVKDVAVAPGARHVCYCLTPPRYLWEMEETYLATVGPLQRFAARRLFPWLRARDRAAARRVDAFIACSEHVRGRIARHYGRDAAVVYPPVDVFDAAPPDAPREGYLAVGQLVAYKRFDLAVAALGRLGRTLTVIGDGPERARLERMAGPGVTFLGWRPDDEVRQRMRACRALVFPGEEDFGIVPVEAQMAGRPVIAYRRGGALETVVDGVTGLFFDRPDAELLAEAVVRFEGREAGFSPDAIRENALRFRPERFREALATAIGTTTKQHDGRSATEGAEDTENNSKTNK